MVVGVDGVRRVMLAAHPCAAAQVICSTGAGLARPQGSLAARQNNEDRKNVVAISPTFVCELLMGQDPPRACCLLP